MIYFDHVILINIVYLTSVIVQRRHYIPGGLALRYMSDAFAAALRPDTQDMIKIEVWLSLCYFHGLLQQLTKKTGSWAKEGKEAVTEIEKVVQEVTRCGLFSMCYIVLCSYM